MSNALFDFNHYQELFEAMELKEALYILDLAESGCPSFETDIAINDFKTYLSKAVNSGDLSFDNIEGLTTIAISDIELLTRIFFPEKIG